LYTISPRRIKSAKAGFIERATNAPNGYGLDGILGIRGKRQILVSLIVIPQLNYIQNVPIRLINNSVFIRNAARPIT